MRKNVASQVVGAQMVTASDGSAFTSTVTVYVTGDAGTQAIGSVGSGVCTHEGNGFHTYAPAQSETNYNHIAFTFVGTGAIPVTNQVYTISYDPHDTADLGLSTLDAAISTRLASASYTAPLDAAGTRSAVGLAAANLDTQLGTIDSNVDAILVDTGTTLETHLTDIKGATFSGTTDSLEAIRDRGDAAWITAVGFSTHSAADVWAAGTRTLTASLDPTAAAIADAVWDEVLSGHLTAGTTGAALNAAGGAGDPWSTSIPGAYGAGTAGYILGNNIDAAISSRLATAGYTAPLDAAGTRSAVGLAAANLDTQLLAIVTDTAEIGLAGAGLTNINLPNQTMDITGNITGNLSGSVGSVTGNVGGIAGTITTLDALNTAQDAQHATTQAATTAIETDTQDIQSRLPAALVGGRMSSDVGSIGGDTGGVAGLDRATRCIGLGTVGVGSTTTSIVTSSLAPTPSDPDQLKGRIVVFDSTTATAGLRGQATDITAVSGTTLTVTALTRAPASGDTFTVQ